MITAATGESMGINGLIRLNETRQACIGELEVMNRLFRERQAKKIAKKLRNSGELVVKEQIEQDKQEFFWVVYVCESNVDQTRRNFPILKQRAALERPTFSVKLCYSEVQNHALPRFWIAAQHTEYYGYFRKRIWKTTCSRRTTLHSLQQFQEFGIIFSRTQGPDAEWISEKSESEMRRELQHSSILVLRFWSGGGRLNHTGGTCCHSGVIDDPRVPIFELHLCKFPDSGISMLESQLQNWGMFKISRSSSQIAIDQRSWDSEIDWLSHDLAIEYRAKRFHRLRHVWCDDCVCIEKTSRQACSFPKKE